MVKFFPESEERKGYPDTCDLRNSLNLNRASVKDTMIKFMKVKDKDQILECQRKRAIT